MPPSSMGSSHAHSQPKGALQGGKKAKVLGPDGAQQAVGRPKPGKTEPSGVGEGSPGLVGKCDADTKGRDGQTNVPDASTPTGAGQKPGVGGPLQKGGRGTIVAEKDDPSTSKVAGSKGVAQKAG